MKKKGEAVSEHTPGPWVVSQDWVMTRSGSRICTVDGEVSVRVEADAALIAAAPDLLAALDVTLHELMETAAEFRDRDGTIAFAIGSATAALAKARGLNTDAATPEQQK